MNAAVKPCSWKSPKKVRKMRSTVAGDDLKSYEMACKDDFKLQLFNSELQQLAQQAICSLTNPGDQRPLSLASLEKVIDSLIQINLTVENFIVEPQENVGSDEEFSSLVDFYLQSSNTMLELCNALENGVTQAKISRILIRRASKEIGRRGAVLEQLKSFQATVDEPFKDFFRLLEKVYDQQVEFLEKLPRQKRKSVKKLTSNVIKPSKRASNVMFAAATVSLVILSVVAEPTLAGEMAGALSAAAEGWINESWKKYEEAVERKKGVPKLREIGEITAVSDMTKLVDKIIGRLETQQDGDDELTCGEDEAAEVRQWMEALTKEVDEFVDKVDELGRKASDYIRQTVAARSTVVDQTLNCS